MWRLKSPASQLFAQPVVQAQIKENINTPLAFVKGIHRWPVDFPLKGPGTGKMIPFDDVIILFKYLI